MPPYPYFSPGEVIAIAKRRGNKKTLQAYCTAHASQLRNLSEDTYDLICALLNSKTLLQNKEHYYNTEKEDFDMCKAMIEWEQEALEKGKKLGEKSGEKKGKDKLSTLIQMLNRDGRMDDIIKVTSNAKVRRRLYREYSIL